MIQAARDYAFALADWQTMRAIAPVDDEKVRAETDDRVVVTYMLLELAVDEYARALRSP